MDTRLNDLQVWLQQQQGHKFSLTALAGDASFRRYFLLQQAEKKLIAVDAPPPGEENKSFVAVAKALAQQGVLVPEVHAVDFERGFMLLSYLGDQHYLDVLNEKNAQALYYQAFESLLKIHQTKQVQDWSLPHFDAKFMLRELSNFDYWFLQQHAQLTLTVTQKTLLQKTFTQLVASAEQQPQVFVHRDYHSRNLMYLPNKEVGVLDFQDAVWGPICYDVVSLLRDCYVAWPLSQVEKWLRHFQLRLQEEKIIEPVSSEQFLRWFDWMGIQRHLKAIFIFARKWLRDDEQSFLADIPRTLNYVITVSEKYPELAEFRHFLLQEEIKQCVQ